MNGAAQDGKQTDPIASKAETDAAREAYGAVAGNRWIQLIAGVVAMVVISNYQYAFTLFTPSISKAFSEPTPKVVAIFSWFILFETWPMPVAGFFVDKLGIRKLMTMGAVLILSGWVLGGTIATSVFHLYVFYGLMAGTGAGIIYISAVANAVKWFPDRRGLAAGLTAAGFGGGAALTIMPIASTIKSVGWAHTMVGWGIAQGLIAFAAAMILRHPPVGWAPRGRDPGAKRVAPKTVAQSRINFTWSQVLRRPEFYLLYLMFLFAVLGGLMATANLSGIAKSLKVSDMQVFGLAIVPLTATLTAVFNAFSRIMWGTISDKLGRENTMAIAFGIEAILIFLVTKISGNPMAFVVVFSLVFLFWGEVFSLFSATTGDVFGPKNASVNYGMLYSAKGLGSIVAGYGAALLAGWFAGSFSVPFYVSSILCLVSASVAFFALKPVISRRIAKESSALGVPDPGLTPAAGAALGGHTPGGPRLT